MKRAELLDMLLPAPVDLYVPLLFVAYFGYALVVEVPFLAVSTLIAFPLWACAVALIDYCQRGGWLRLILRSALAFVLVSPGLAAVG